MGKFVISKAKNGEVILSASETYATLDSCKAGVESVRKNAPDAQVVVEEE